MFVTPKHKNTDFSQPLTLEDKITIFVERTWGWQLDIADKCINEHTNADGSVVKAIPDSGFAVLFILLGYFEMIAKLQDGFIQVGKRGKSEDYFQKGVYSVFPILKSYPENVVNSLLDILYGEGRCGLYHSGFTAGGIILSGDVNEPMVFDPQNQKLIINPHRLAPALKGHLKSYEQQLKDPANAELREKFERRFDYQSKIQKKFWENSTGSQRIGTEFA